MHFQMSTFLAIGAFLLQMHHIKGECLMINQYPDGNGPIETNTKLCVPQGEGDWTFGMETTLATVPGGDGDAAEFYIFDNTCKIRGQYDPPSQDPDNNCGIPFTAKESFLPLVLTVTDVSFDVGDPYFQFSYGDGTYSINNNGCDCVSDNQGTVANEKCKCGFPVDGNSSGKRSIAFRG
ncbi:hypothetical protein BDV96DRAFT_600260 [Lophiotrema nucula]|uniref:Uncharacterized protein n=1 Tax=Lophiotrema nucula TaxID=690887 RepID=A0A6A5Z6M1_9PLEO|nr:hypothetical protein BDV96DRAFT_600260 [Lophiotrema nucula]